MTTVLTSAFKVALVVGLAGLGLLALAVATRAA